MAEFYRRKKICQMCAGKSVDYKDVMIVSKYINEKGKYYLEEWLEHVQNIKDILLIKLKEQDLWLYYHLKNNRISIIFLFIKLKVVIFSYYLFNCYYYF